MLEVKAKSLLQTLPGIKLESCILSDVRTENQILNLLNVTKADHGAYKGEATSYPHENYSDERFIPVIVNFKYDYMYWRYIYNIKQNLLYTVNWFESVKIQDYKKKWKYISSECINWMLNDTKST